MAQAIIDEIGQILPPSRNLAETLARAADYAAQQGHPEVTLDHLLLALTEDPDATLVLGISRIDVEQLKGDVSSHLGRLDDRSGGEGAAGISDELRQILEAAAAAARGRRETIDGAIVLAAIVGDGRSTAAHMLRAHGLTFEEAIRALQEAAQASEAVERPIPPGTGAMPPAAAPSRPPPEEPSPLPRAAESPMRHPQVTNAEDILASARQRVQGRIVPGLGEDDSRDERGSGERNETRRSITEADLRKAEAEADAEFDRITEELTSQSRQAEADTAEGDDGRAVHHAQTSEVPAKSKASGGDVPVAPAPAKPARRPSPPGAIRPHAAPPGPVATPPPSPISPSPPHGVPQMHPQSQPAHGRQQAPAGDPVRPQQGEPRPQRPPAAMPPQLPPGRPIGTGGPPPPPHQGLPPHHRDHMPGTPIRPPGGPGHAMPPPPPPGRFPTGAPVPGLPGGVPKQRAGAPQPPMGSGGAPAGQAPRWIESASAQAARGPASASGVPTGAPPSRGRLSDVALGQMVENIPRAMQVGVPVVAEARVARADVKALAEGLQGGGAVWRHDLTVTRAMSVRLRAPDGGFFIETSSPETQWIENTLGLITDDYASWRWTVTPRASGARKLQLVISARTVGTDGLAAETALPDQIIDVKVRINYVQTARRVGGWALAAIAGGVLAQFGGDLPGAIAKVVGAIIK